MRIDFNSQVGAILHKFDTHWAVKAHKGLTLSAIITLLSVPAIMLISNSAQAQIYNPEFNPHSVPLPHERAHQGVGVVGATTCGSSTCHDTTSIWPNSSVEQNEYKKWRLSDPHSQSYYTLLSDKARQIATRLNLETPPQESATCLGCHSFDVNNTYAETTTRLEDGVTCEACHGPAEKWMGVHSAGLFFYDENIRAGLYPTTDPVARTQLCLSCHVGTKDKMVDHEMLAAGHPRLTFEVNFYSWFSAHELTGQNYYSHFEVDSDYRQRKPLPYGLKVWAIGQTQQVEHILGLLTDPDVQPTAYPELSLFNCASCHREISDGVLGNTGPGYPRLNTSNMNILRVICKIVSPYNSAALDRKIQRVESSLQLSWTELRRAVADLNIDVKQLSRTVANYTFTTQDSQSAIRYIADPDANLDFSESQLAEQTLFAVASIVDELYRKDSITEADFREVRTILNSAFAKIGIEKPIASEDIRQALISIQGVVS